jgi:hypothetical protein
MIVALRSIRTSKKWVWGIQALAASLRHGQEVA